MGRLTVPAAGLWATTATVVVVPVLIAIVFGAFHSMADAGAGPGAAVGATAGPAGATAGRTTGGTTRAAVSGDWAGALAVDGETCWCATVVGTALLRFVFASAAALGV